MSKIARAARVASRQRTETISGTKVLETAETGELYLVGAAASVTLPAVQDGAYFKFVLSADITSATALVVIAAGSAAMAGNIIATRTTNLEETVQAPVSGGNTTITIGSTGNKVLTGSFIECVCDGTNWFVNGVVSGDNTDITACAFS